MLLPFGGFREGTWKHIGTNIESKIDANFERLSLQNIVKPIIHENLGHGKGDFGDPDSVHHDEQHLEAFSEDK